MSQNLITIPGVIDLHVHLRDMGQADKETVASGTMAALAGGVTTVLTMPNTVPRLDNAETIRRYQALAKDAPVNVHIAGAISKGLNGKELAALDDYPGLGIKFITDDGFDIDDGDLLLRAYQKVAALGLIVMPHPEVMSIAPNGVVNEGIVSKKLGVPGQPNEKEWKAVERAIRLSAKIGARVHLTHLSTKESVGLVREAKKKSDLVTCDVTPHHISLTEDLVLKVGSLAKVNPPLRTEADRQALIEGIKDGTVDFLVTDHAPHEEKDPDLMKASFGFSGLETFVPAVLTELYHKQGMAIDDIAALITTNPAKIAGLKPRGSITIDLNLTKTVDRHQFVSKGKNSPFHGMPLKGWPMGV